MRFPVIDRRAVVGATVALASLAAVAATSLTVATGAQAKASTTGDFAVTLNGTTYNPAFGRDAKFKNVAASGPIGVRGINVGFTIDPSTLGVYNYTLTGAPSPDRMVTSPTVIFSSKVPQLSAAQLAHPVVSELEVKDDTVTVTLGTAAGKLKVQAKDAPTGGIFQMEPEFGAPVTLVHVLGPTLFYFVNPFTNKINYGNGIDPVTPAQSASGAHQMLLGKDSPQVATKTFQDGTTTRWSVTSGGRMGGVLGEDAIELSAGAANCTSQCQAQDRIRGSCRCRRCPPTRHRSAADRARWCRWLELQSSMPLRAAHGFCSLPGSDRTGRPARSSAVARYGR